MHTESEKQVMNEHINTTFDHKSNVSTSISDSFVKPECGMNIFRDQ